MFRVQKILLAEYDEVYEPVLVENPMVLVDGRGYGLRQYYMGLTCNLLIFGCDRIVEPTEMPTYRSTDVDSEIECFDLVCMLPLQCLRFHFYRKGSRYLMMVTALQPSGQPLDGAMEPMIFEFGGHLYRQHYWHTWRERVASIRADAAALQPDHRAFALLQHRCPAGGDHHGGPGASRAPNALHYEFLRRGFLRPP